MWRSPAFFVHMRARCARADIFRALVKWPIKDGIFAQRRVDRSRARIYAFFAAREIYYFRSLARTIWLKLRILRNFDTTFFRTVN